jgi:prephenate dehydrogenase
MEDRFTPQNGSRHFRETGFSSSRILLAGLGLIGGSAAKALKNAGYGELYGFDSDKGVLDAAIREGVVLGGFTDITPLPEFDLMLCCLPPAAAAEFCRGAQSRLKDGGVFAEMGGIKRGVTDDMAAALEGNRELLSLHPMAGKEKSGYIHSDADLLRGSVLIFTPTKKTRVNAILWASILQKALGCIDIRELSARRHDEVIARVSHLPHIIALAVKAMEGDGALQPFAGGSYKSVMRVAGLSPTLWAELFSGNRDNVLACISQFKASLSKLEQALEQGDAGKLYELIKEISESGE